MYIPVTITNDGSVFDYQSNYIGRIESISQDSSSVQVRLTNKQLTTALYGSIDYYGNFYQFCQSNFCSTCSQNPTFPYACRYNSVANSRAGYYLNI